MTRAVAAYPRRRRGEIANPAGHPAAICVLQLAPCTSPGRKILLDFRSLLPPAHLARVLEARRQEHNVAVRDQGRKKKSWKPRSRVKPVTKSKTARPGERSAPAASLVGCVVRAASGPPHDRRLSPRPGALLSFRPPRNEGSAALLVRGAAGKVVRVTSSRAAGPRPGRHSRRTEHSPRSAGRECRPARVAAGPLSVGRRSAGQVRSPSRGSRRVSGHRRRPGPRRSRPRFQ